MTRFMIHGSSFATPKMTLLAIWTLNDLAGRLTILDNWPGNRRLIEYDNVPRPNGAIWQSIATPLVETAVALSPKQPIISIHSATTWCY